MRNMFAMYLSSADDNRRRDVQKLLMKVLDIPQEVRQNDTFDVASVPFSGWQEQIQFDT